VNSEKTALISAAADGEHTWRGRGGRRGGRGCRGGGFKRGEWKNNSERVDAKIARLTDRHAALTAKFIESDLPEEKARGLEWRLCHLQNKIDTLQARKAEQLSDAGAVKKEEHQQTEATTPTDTPTPLPEDDNDEEEDHHGWHRRGRRGGGGHCRGGRRGGYRKGGEHCDEEEGGEEPAGGEGRTRGGCGGPQVFACSTPEGKIAFDRLQACKEAVMAARREKAGKEVIMSKIEELKAAKADWKELKLALWKEKRAAAASCPKKEAK